MPPHTIHNSAFDLDLPGLRSISGGRRSTSRFAAPRHAVRYGQQKVWFRGHFPEHVILIQRDGWWEVVGQERFPSQAVPPSRLAGVKLRLWDSPLPVVWIHETGRRVSRIAERVVAEQWTWSPENTG